MGSGVSQDDNASRVRISGFVADGTSYCLVVSYSWNVEFGCGGPALVTKVQFAAFRFMVFPEPESPTVFAPRMQEFADEVGEVLQAILCQRIPGCWDLDSEEEVVYALEQLTSAPFCKDSLCRNSVLLVAELRPQGLRF